MRRTAVGLAALAVLAVAAPGCGTVLRNVEYARPGGPKGKPLLLDLYLPKSEHPAPVILWVHGGGWRRGSKAHCPAVAMVPRGYAVASIDYRLSDEATFPAQIHDCKAAVRWLRAHAPEYTLDADRIGAWGASAGGHLVALLGTTGGVKDLEGEGLHVGESSRVQAVCDFFGPTDLVALTRAFTRGKADPAHTPMAKLIGGPVLANQDTADRANPIRYITADDPPFLIMHGDRDRLVPVSQSRLLHGALKKAGIESTLHVVKGAGHGFGGPAVGAKVVAFFDRHLKKPASPASAPTTRPAQPRE